MVHRRAAEQPEPSRSPPIPAKEDEAALVERIRAGDAAAFETMFKTYYSPLAAFVLSYVRSPTVAEDQVQDVLLWVWEQRDRLVIRSGLKSYLYAAARNRALNWLRHERLAGVLEPDVVHLFDVPAIPIDAPESEDRMACLVKAVERLPERRRQAFNLRWQHGMSYSEIASVMGISVKTVDAMLAQAIAALREELKGAT